MKRLLFLILAVLVLLPGFAQAKIFLADTDDTLQVVTASGVSTIHMYASWADITTTAITPGSSTARVTTATTTTLVAAPASSTQRQIKGMTVRNNHASSSNVVTVRFFDGTNATELIQYTLLAGETLEWGEDYNFRVIDASGQLKGLQASTQSGTWNITNVSGTVSLPTGAATAANQDGIIKDGTGDSTQANVINGYLQVENHNANLAADNSTLSTSKVPVMPGTVSTSAPTWTNGNQSALSLQTDGSVRAAVTNTVAITANSSVNVAQMNGVATTMGNGASGTGVQRVTLANDSTGVLATVNSLTQMNGQTIAMGTGTRSAGTQRVTIATDDVVPASQSGTWTVQPGNTANTTPWLTSPIPATSGGTSVCYITSAASTNATNCKASAGQLYGFDLVNTTATIYYLRIYNSSSAPTCSSATGFVRTIPIPAATTGAGIARAIPMGEAYGTGLGFCLTGGGSSTDNTNAATGVYVSLNYK